MSRVRTLRLARTPLACTLRHALHEIDICDNDCDTSVLDTSIIADAAHRCEMSRLPTVGNMDMPYRKLLHNNDHHRMKLIYMTSRVNTLGHLCSMAKWQQA